LIGALVALTGCGGGGSASGSNAVPPASTPAPTPPVSASAIAFSGPVTDTLFGSGTFTIAYFKQSGTAVSGTWGMVYTTSAWMNGGSFTGTLSGGTLTGLATSNTDYECNLNVSATVTGTTSMTGAYDADCSDGNSATFTATAFTIPQLSTYSGTVTNSEVPAGGTLALTLAQYNVYLSGSYADAFPTMPSFNNTNGLAYGVVTGPATVSYYLLVPTLSAGCSLILNGTLSVGAVAGSYVSQDCTQNENGTFSL
jgi:hypothetical protein